MHLDYLLFVYIMSEFSPLVQPSDADVIGSSEDFMLADNDPTTSDTYSISDIVEHFTGEYNPDLARLIRDSNYGSDLMGKAFVEDENSVVADDKITKAEFDQMVKDVSIVPEKTYDGGVSGGFSIADAVRFLDNRFSGPLTDEQKAEFRTVWSAIRDAVNDPENESDLYDKYMAAQKDGKLAMSEYVDLYNTAFPDKPITEEMINPDFKGGVVSELPETVDVVVGQTPEVVEIEAPAVQIPEDTSYRAEGGEGRTVRDIVTELSQGSDSIDPAQASRDIVSNTPTAELNDIVNNGMTEEKLVELLNKVNPENPVTVIPSGDPGTPGRIIADTAKPFTPPVEVPAANVEEARDSAPSYTYTETKFTQNLNGEEVLGVEITPENNISVTGKNGARLTDENGNLNSYVQIGENPLQITGRITNEGATLDEGVKLENFNVKNEQGEVALSVLTGSVSPEITVLQDVTLGDTEANGLGAIKADQVTIEGQKVVITGASANNIEAQSIEIGDLEVIRNSGSDFGYLRVEDFKIQPEGDRLNLSIDLNGDKVPDVELKGVVLENGNFDKLSEVLQTLNVNSFLLSLTGGEAYTPATKLVEESETSPAPEINQPENIQDYNVQNLRDSLPTYTYTDKEFSQSFDGHTVGSVKLNESGAIEGYGANGELLTDAEGNWTSYISLNGQTSVVTGVVENLGDPNKLETVGLTDVRIENLGTEGEVVLAIEKGSVSPTRTEMNGVMIGDTTENQFGPINAEQVVIEGTKVEITKASADGVKAESIELNLEEVRKLGPDISNLGNENLQFSTKDGKFDVTILGENKEPMVIIKGAELDGKSLGDLTNIMGNLTVNSFLLSLVGGSNAEASQTPAQPTSEASGSNLTEEEKEELKKQIEESGILETEPQTSAETQTIPQGESIFAIKEDGGVELFEGFTEAIQNDPAQAEAVVSHFEPHVVKDSDSYNIRIDVLQKINEADLPEDGILTEEIYNDVVDKHYYENYKGLKYDSGHGPYTLDEIYNDVIGDNNDEKYTAFVRQQMNDKEGNIWNNVKWEDEGSLAVITPRKIDEYIAKDAEYIQTLKDSGEPFILLAPSEIEEMNKLGTELQEDFMQNLGNIPIIQGKLEGYISMMEPSLSSADVTARASAIMSSKEQGFDKVTNDYLITFGEYETFMERLGFEVTRPTK
jgi:hypothetical protein